MGAVGDLVGPGVLDAGQDEGDGVGVGDLADPAGHQDQGVVLLRPGQQQRRQLLGHGHPLLAAAGLAVQAGVLHGDGGGLRQGLDGGDVPAGEAAGLVAQVQPPVALVVGAQGRGQDAARVLALDDAGEGRRGAQVVDDDDAVVAGPTQERVDRKSTL